MNLKKIRITLKNRIVERERKRRFGWWAEQREERSEGFWGKIDKLLQIEVRLL